MNEEHFYIIGELSPEERNFIKSKMSLEELIVAAHEIDNEINMFEARWFDKVDILTYKSAISLIFAEIDRYPTIKKYNAHKQDDLQSDLAIGLIESLGCEDMINWAFVKSRLIERLTPNRWV